VTFDPGDDPIARMALLEQLDMPDEAFDYDRVFDPSYRTIGGQPLDADQTELLLSCTVDDMNALADIINERAAHQRAHAAVLNELAAVTTELTALAAPFSQNDGIEKAVIRMPAETRRQVRRLQNRIAELERTIAAEYGGPASS
jgi:hypothetical protein